MEKHEDLEKYKNGCHGSWIHKPETPIQDISLLKLSKQLYAEWSKFSVPADPRSETTMPPHYILPAIRQAVWPVPNVQLHYLQFQINLLRMWQGHSVCSILRSIKKGDLILRLQMDPSEDGYTCSNVLLCCNRAFKTLRTGDIQVKNSTNTWRAKQEASHLISINLISISTAFTLSPYVPINV